MTNDNERTAMNNYEIKWRYPFDPKKQDAVWFYGDRHLATATLTTETGETYSLDIYCDGETKYRVPYLDEDGSWEWHNHEVIRYENEWNAIGVHTDADLYAFYNEWADRGFDIHEYNSWFDLYTEIDGVSQHLDAVTHTQEDADAMALSILTEVATAGGWERWFAQAA